MYSKHMRVPLLNFTRRLNADQRGGIDGSASQQALHIQLFSVYKETLRDALHKIAARERHFKHGSAWMDNIACEREAVVDHLHGHVQRVTFHVVTPPPTPRMVACEPPSTCQIQ